MRELTKEFKEFEKRLKEAYVADLSAAQERIAARETTIYRKGLLEEIGGIEQEIQFTGQNADEIVKVQKLITNLQGDPAGERWTLEEIQEAASRVGVDAGPDRLLALFIACRGPLIMVSLQNAQKAIYAAVTGSP